MPKPQLSSQCSSLNYVRKEVWGAWHSLCISSWNRKWFELQSPFKLGASLKSMRRAMGLAIEPHLHTLSETSLFNAVAHYYSNFDWSVTDFLAGSKPFWCLMCRVWESTRKQGSRIFWNSMTLQQMAFTSSYHWKMKWDNKTSCRKVVV